MNTQILTLREIREIVLPLARKYHIGEIYIFGSYARNEATAHSDIDFLVIGGAGFKPTSVFAFAEELRKVMHKDIDVFEISEVNEGSAFYNSIMKERVQIA